MNKKGFLFTIFTLLMLVSLVFISIAYVNWYSSYKSNLVVDLSNAHKISYIVDDIASDVFELFDFDEITITRGSGLIYIQFNDLFNTSRNYSVSLEGYEEFIEDDYGSLVGANIDLEDLEYSFDIPGYNITSYQIGPDYYVVTDQYDLIRGVNLTMTVFNISKWTNSIDPADDGEPHPKIQVTVYDKNGATLLDAASRQNPEQNNPRFSVNFLTGDDLDIYFENDPQDGSLHINYDYDFIVHDLTYTLVDLNETIAFGAEGSVYVDPRVGDIVHYGDIVGFEG